MRIKKGKEKVRWQEAIIGIAMAAIILASVFAVMTGSVSAYSTGGKYKLVRTALVENIISSKRMMEQDYNQY
jgi:hypothetical protein